MAKKFLTSLGLVSLASDPVSGTEGELYYNNVSDGVRLYKNGAWTDLSSTGALPSGGATGQILAKSSNTDYAVEWIENYADWTEIVKVKVKNDGTRALYKGEPVYVTGSDGTNVLVGRSSNVTEGGSSKTIGILSENLATNGIGYVVKEGKLGTLDTSAAGAVGDPVWLGVDGALIYGLANKPYAPAHLVYLGVVTKKNGSTGEIFVQVQNGFEIRELHDVGIGYSASIQNNEILAYNSASSLWINQTASESGIATTEDLYDYLTTASATLLYQPISVRLYNLTALENVEGFLRTDGGLGWGIDTAEYLTTGNASSTYLTQLDALGLYLTQIDAENTYLTSETSASIYQPLDDDLTAIAALSGSSGFLKKNVFNDWVIDSNTYLTTYDASTTYQPTGNYATIDGVETLTNKTMSSAFIDGTLTFNDIDYEHTISSASNSFTINAYDNLYLTTTIGDIVLQPDHFVKIYDEYVATQEWVNYQNYLTIGSASTTYSEINHNHTLDSLSNVEISSLSDGDSIVWNSASSKWINQIIEGGGGSSVTISSSAPASPLEGDLWFDSDTLELFIFDSLYWIEVSGGGAVDLSSYLTIASASSTYLTQTSASSTYLSQDSASSTYQPIGSYLTSESDTLSSVTSRGATTSDVISITSTESSTSTSTGALVVSGGVGIGGELHVGSDIHIDGDINVTGSISGSLTYLNVTDLVVTDPLIYLADSNPNDMFDIGIFAAYNHSSSVQYHSGLIRDASDSGKWKLASNLLDPVSNVIDFTGANFDTLVVGNIEAINASLSGSVSLGAVVSGYWSGDQISYEYGGTGLTTIGTAGQVLAVNSGVTGLEWTTLDALPSQSGNNGKYLTTDGSTASWGTLDLSLYLTQSSASSTYLTQSNASSTYLTQSNASSIYLTQSNASSTYLTQSNASLTYLTQTSASTTYATKVSPTLTTPNIGAATGTSLNTTGNVISHVDILTPTFVTNSYTLQIGDDGDLLMLNNSTTAGNLLIPTDASVNFPVGTQINIVQQGTGLITVLAVTPGTTTINATPGTKLRAQWSSAAIVKTAANTWLLMGDLTV
jgi:hypothetical protein